MNKNNIKLKTSESYKSIHDYADKLPTENKHLHTDNLQKVEDSKNKYKTDMELHNSFMSGRPSLYDTSNPESKWNFRTPDELRSKLGKYHTEKNIIKDINKQKDKGVIKTMKNSLENTGAKIFDKTHTQNFSEDKEALQRLEQFAEKNEDKPITAATSDAKKIVRLSKKDK